MDNINTVDYWNNRFESHNGLTDWELCGGRLQSENFMKSILNNLNEIAFETIDDMKVSSILDFGCALGDGTNILKEHLSNDNITGYDFSRNAIELSNKMFKGIKFDYILDTSNHYDYIICSNVLQHVDNYKEIIKDMLLLTSKMLIILVPFGTYGISKEHYNSFQFNSFDKDIKDFTRRKMKTIQTDSWKYKQILVRYERV